MSRTARRELAVASVADDEPIPFTLTPAAETAARQAGELDRLRARVAELEQQLADAVPRRTLIAVLALVPVLPGGPAVKAFRAAHPDDPTTWSPAQIEGYLDAQDADLASGAVRRPMTAVVTS